MNNETWIGSVNIGNEAFFITDYFKKNNECSLLYIARNDKEIFDIKSKIKWLIPSAELLIYRSWPIGLLDVKCHCSLDYAHDQLQTHPQMYSKTRSNDLYGRREILTDDARRHTFSNIFSSAFVKIMLVIVKSVKLKFKLVAGLDLLNI